MDEMGRCIGRSKANVSLWESGRHRPSAEMLTLISSLTGYPLPGEFNDTLTPESELKAMLIGAGVDEGAFLPPQPIEIKGFSSNDQYTPDLVIQRENHDEPLLVEVVSAPASRASRINIAALRIRLAHARCNVLICSPDRASVDAILAALKEAPSPFTLKTASLVGAGGNQPDAWPFQRIKAGRWAALSEGARGYIEAKLETLIEQAEAEAKHSGNRSAA